MKLRDLLDLIKNTAIKNNTSGAFICGGVVRDKVIGNIKNNFADLDITTGDKSIHHLASEISFELRKKYNITTKKADDGHTSIIFPGNDFKLDFSSNFENPGIETILLKRGIKNPTNIQKEMYSRDFTCNALLMSLDLKKITDPTHLGINDINKKIIKTCLDPQITLKYNTNRIIRVIYLAAKLDFDVDQKIIDWISKNKNLIKLSSDAYLTKNIDKAISKDPEKTLYLVNKMSLWDILPPINSLLAYKQKPKTAQIKQNYDYDDGMFSNLNKYKSVSDFRKKRRKKRMQEIKKIKSMKLK